MHPASGRNLELILPAADTDWMGRALEEFARWADPAGAKRLGVPPNVLLHPLPPCTPELQPAEPLWPLVREAVANEGFDELGAMEAVLEARCRWLIDHPDVVRGAVGFHWAVALNG